MLNIALGFDSNFAPYAAVTIKSIIIHNKNIKFYIMYDNLKKSDIKKIEKLIMSGENCTVKWINMSGKFDHLNAGHWKSKSVYFPVALPSICTDDRILFLDADILVTGNIEQLYNQNMDGYYFAGAVDYGIMLSFEKNEIITSETFGGRIHCKDFYKNVFNYTKTEDFKDYINGGILLLNLKEMRKDNIENQMYNSFNKIDFACNEQDCYNYICKDKKKILSKEEAFLILQNNIIENLPEEIKKDYIDNYNEYRKHLIVHLIKKPWIQPEDDIPYAKMFHEIRKQTPYRYYRHRKEIFKFRYSKNSKYLILFGHNIFNTKQETVLK